MRKLALVGAALAAVLVAPAAPAADTYSIDPAHSTVGFQIRHLISKVGGRFNEFSGTIVMDRDKPEASSVAFTIKAASIDTATPDRDKHLRSADFFDVDKHPEIRFKSSSVKASGKDAYEVTGTFTMLGVSKEITLPVSYTGSVKDPWGNTKAGFETSTTLNRKDYGMVWNKALDAGGLVLGDEVQVQVALEAKLEAPEAAAGAAKPAK